MKAAAAIVAVLVVSAPAPAQTGLPLAFAKTVPESLRDLQDIERHVQKMIARTLPATVCLRTEHGNGSGVIVNRTGHILTAGHVSGEAGQDLFAILHDGSQLEGRTLGAHKAVDSGMAVITEKGDFPYVEMARTGSVKKGDWCLALGHPNGWKPGRPPVARLGRVLEVGKDHIVTDCILVGGDSGGPLFDMHGRVIAIHSRIGDKLNINVHVPIGTYHDGWRRLVAGDVWGAPLSVIETAKAADAYLGVQASSPDDRLKITSITPGSPAARAGLKAGDIVLRIDNLKFKTVDDLALFLKAQRPGTPITIHVRRGNQLVPVQVVLGKRMN